MILQFSFLIYTSHHLACIFRCFQPFSNDLLQTPAAGSVDLDAVDEAADTGDAAPISLPSQLLLYSNACHDIAKSLTIIFMVVVEGQVRPLCAAARSLCHFVPDVDGMAQCRNLVAEEY